MINNELEIKKEIINNSKNKEINEYKSKLRSNNKTNTNRKDNNQANIIIFI